MRRFISHDELARDERFRRTRSRNQLLRNLPDEVDAIVRGLEQVGPKIRKRVEGTTFEKAYDELGPGFQFLTASGGPQPEGERTAFQLRAQLHGIFVGELQAL